MNNILIENAKQILTCSPEGTRFKSGKAQSEIGLLENSSIYIENGKIKWVGKKLPADLLKKNVKKINAKNKVVMPGFIDSHTHLVFAGDRANEYAMRLAGKTYEEIANAGGGIVNTVDAVRKCSKEKLKELAKKRIDNFISFGVTTMEAKSGYGLDVKNEIKMLEVINELNDELPVDIIPAFLGAHAIPKDKTKEEYLDIILYEMIPQIAKRKLAFFIDVFCEMYYFSAEETDKIFKQAISFGLVPKLHTNQFYSIGGIETAIANKASSVDHLEVMKESEVQQLKDTGIVACVLPGVSYFLNIQYAPARRFIENDVPVAIATDFNPGSCMTENIQLLMSLAAHKMEMKPEEIINAVTINAAAALCISDRAGSIEVGKQGDVVIFDMPDYNNLLYHFGVNCVESVIKNGKVIN
ncbi:MAG: imidazolonepropionase [Ignavibacteriae bacterium]|nr:MAG: imidazolonepropionase [Ignavibacteriota bacterium]